MKCVESKVHLPARPLRSRSHVKRLEYGSIPESSVYNHSSTHEEVA